jgi:hypothetical protein
MPRTLNDFSMQRVFPAAGRYQVNIISIEKGVSKQKKTPQITLVFSDGENEFDDQIYVTEKTIPRLCLVAKRVCLMDEKTQLPDVDIDAANMVAKYIMSNALGKKCIVKIEENEETIIIDNGPNIGQKKTIKRRRVAYNGYERYVEPQAGSDDMPFDEQTTESGGELPF